MPGGSLALLLRGLDLSRSGPASWGFAGHGQCPPDQGPLIAPGSPGEESPEVGMDCEQALSLVSAEMDRELSSQDRPRLEEHLQSCAQCRLTAESVRRQDID